MAKGTPWWELTDHSIVKAPHLDDFFCEHLYVLDGAADVLLDIYVKAEITDDDEEIGVTGSAVMLLYRIVERAVHDIRERIELVNGQVQALVAAQSQEAKAGPAAPVAGRIGKAKANGAGATKHGLAVTSEAKGSVRPGHPHRSAANGKGRQAAAAQT